MRYWPFFRKGSPAGIRGFVNLERDFDQAPSVEAKSRVDAMVKANENRRGERAMRPGDVLVEESGVAVVLSHAGLWETVRRVK